MRRATRRDKTHDEIVKDLRDRCIAVEDMALAGDGFPDLMTHWNETVLIEIKDTSASSVKFSQIKFMARWPGPVGFAVGAAQAYRLAIDPKNHALTAQQKWKMQKIVDEFPDRDRIALSVVLKRIGPR